MFNSLLNASVKIVERNSVTNERKLINQGIVIIFAIHLQRKEIVRDAEKIIMREKEEEDRRFLFCVILKMGNVLNMTNGLEMVLVQNVIRITITIYAQGNNMHNPNSYKNRYRNLI